MPLNGNVLTGVTKVHLVLKSLLLRIYSTPIVAVYTNDTPRDVINQ